MIELIGDLVSEEVDGDGMWITAVDEMGWPVKGLEYIENLCDQLWEAVKLLLEKE